MKSISKFTMTAAAFSALMIASPLFAQNKATAPAAASTVAVKLSKGADKPIRALSAVVKAKDNAGYAAALAAAQASATTDDDRYAIAREQLNQGLNTGDVSIQIPAVEAMLASSLLPADQKSKLYAGLASLYEKNNQPAQQIATLQKLLATTPNDSDILWSLGEANVKQNNVAEAASFMSRAVAAGKASGTPLEAKFYRRAMDVAYVAKLKPETLSMARDLFSATTEPAQRKRALLLYRQYGLSSTDQEGRLDVMRLVRKVKGLDEEANILSFAGSLALKNYPAEAESVLKEAIAANHVKAGDQDVSDILREVGGKIASDKAALSGLEARAKGAADGKLAFNVANGYYGHSDYAKAAEFYRAAIQKGGPDTETAKLRLGIALAMAGQNAEAETALKAVSGNRADLASYWLAWLANRG